MATAAILDLSEPKITPFDPPSPKTHPRTKHEVYRITRCGDMATRISWGHMEPPFGGMGGSMVSDGAIRKSDGFLYAVHCDRCAIVVTIRPQFAIEYVSDAQINRGGHFGPKFPGVPIGVDH